MALILPLLCFFYISVLVSGCYAIPTFILLLTRASRLSIGDTSLAAAKVLQHPRELLYEMAAAGC